ncbi:MAG: ATP synthase F1 subunit gamma [Elusimicrobiota bacterium]
MPSLRTIRNKIKTIKSTQQITRAMKMVATARLTRAQGRIIDARPFATRLEGLITEFSTELAHTDAEYDLHPLQVNHVSDNHGIVLLTSDKGLCGAFNTNILRYTLEFIKTHPNTTMFVAGKKGRDFCKRYEIKISKEYTSLFNNISYVHAESIGTDVIDFYNNTKPKSVLVIHQRFKSILQQELKSLQLLPLQNFLVDQNTKKPEYQSNYIFEPGKRELLNSLFPRYIKAQIYRALLESFAAEQAARMTAMDNATNNAEDLIDQMTLEVNKLRQASITRELADIVGTADAIR